MAKVKFSLANKDAATMALMEKTDHRTLMRWALDCAERVMPYFEQHYPDDKRPRQAIEAGETWIATGVFKMTVIRKASLDAHAAARDVGEDNPARSAAHAAGQAVATAHVPSHAIGAANYALQALHRAAAPSDTGSVTSKEREWQYQHLLELGKASAEGG
ncbi:MAG: hypothetical protein U0528_07020 [Anaerolineae bacterium]